MSGHGAPQQTEIDARGLRVVIVAGTWHETISNGLIAGAERVLDAADATDRARMLAGINQASTATSWLGAALYLVAYPILTCCLSYFLFKFGYRSGLEGMQNIMATGQLDKLTNTMTVMGLIVVGALTASFVSVSLPIQITKDVYDATTGHVGCTD